MRHTQFSIQFLSLLSTLILCVVESSAELSEPEKRIVAAVEHNNEAAIQFLKEVVNVNSGTMNLEGVKEVGMAFSEEFKKIGLDTRWVDMAEVNRAGHLFAETEGTQGKRLLLIGHLDTVFPIDSPFQKMELGEDGLWRGPGGNDMKGGNVIILYALKALQELGMLKDTQIIVAFTGDEESAGRPIEVSRKDLIDAAKRSDVALSFEFGGDGTKAVVARRGSSGWTLEVTGKRAHSSRIFSDEVGAGAIFEASRILNAFYEELSGEEYLTFNPGKILGGTTVDTSAGTAFGKGNVVAQTVVVSGGLRFMSEEQKESAREAMRKIVAQNLPHTSATISFRDSYPSMPPTAGNYALLETLNQVSLDLGQGEIKPFDPGLRGAADISFIAEYVDGLDALGALGDGAHSLDETVDLDRFDEQTKRAAILIYRLIQP